MNEQNQLTTERNATVIAAEINAIKEQVRGTVLSASIEIGRRLAEAKRMIPHGSWTSWLQESLAYSERTAQNLMKLADEYGTGVPPSLSDMSTTQAVLLLGVPGGEREAFMEEHADDSTRELKEAVAALKAERDRMQTTIDELTANATDGSAEREQAERAAQEAANQAQQLRAELERLKQETENAAKQDNQKELKKLNAKLAAAEKAEQQAKATLEQAQKAAEDSRADADRLKQELEQAGKPIIQQVIPEEVQTELARLRAQASRASGESELRAAFESLKASYELLVQKLGNVREADADTASKYGAAFGKALRVMAERVEGDK